MRERGGDPLSSATGASPACAERLDDLEAYADGVLRGSALHALEQHLATCPGCRAELDASRRLSRELRALGPLDVPDVDGLLERVHARRHRGLRRRRVLWAASAAMLIGAGGWWLSGSGERVDVLIAPPPASAGISRRARARAELRQAERHYQLAVRLLRQVAEEQGRGWSWSRRQAAQADLAVLERAVQQSKRLARRAPSDPVLQELVSSSYRAEIDYLRDLIARDQGESI